MKKVFYIERELFLRNMLEEAGKTQELEFYTSESVTDCLYIFEDMAPDFLLMDCGAALLDNKGAGEILQSAKRAQIPVFFTGLAEEQKEMENLYGENIELILKPLDAFSLLKKFLGESN